MPSFDIVSDIEQHELSNALDQASRELTTRFDFKGIDAQYVLKDKTLTLTAPSDFQVQQMQDILNTKLAKRNIDIRCLAYQKIEVHLHQARLVADVKEGIETPVAKEIIKFIKDKKFKVQASIQSEQVRVTGKQRDDLQAVMTALKQEDFKVPLQYTNFRD